MKKTVLRLFASLLCCLLLAGIAGLPAGLAETTSPAQGSDATVTQADTPFYLTEPLVYVTATGS